ncbi:flavocytochrome c [Gordonibacter sp.]|uniref:flavocytochrome c n=1 Tax=Gordonibacter sp. TaxID=1968902 RepID=UPI002FC8FD30
MGEAGNLSRRNFIKNGAVAGAGLMGLAALAGCSKASAGQGAAVSWDEETDVIVVGSGYAGFAAAIAAFEGGAEVRIIDKRDSDGGNSIKADGDFAVCCSSPQADQGIKDSVDDYVHDMLVAGLDLNDVEKCLVIAEKSNETWEWVSGLGVQWVKNDQGKIDLLPYGGHSNYRTMKPEGAGQAIVGVLRDKATELGLKVECRTLLKELVRDENGRVLGIVVQKGINETTLTGGKSVAIKAKKAVVLATGGFSGDVAWRMKHDPKLDENLESTNRFGATSEALQVAMRSGALTVHLDWIQLGPWCSPDDGGFGLAWTYIDAGFPRGVVVARQTGKRFVSELTDRKRYCDAIIANGEPSIQIVDQRNLPTWALEYLDQCIEVGCTWRIDSIEEIAQKFDIPLEPLKEEIARYNTFVENKVDEDFGKKIPANALPVAEPPYCVTRVWPKVHHTMGGVKTDAENRVIDVSLNPIEGLYAAGEVAGGIHGACRLGSCATADCLINGRLAGQNAAASESWS